MIAFCTDLIFISPLRSEHLKLHLQGKLHSRYIRFVGTGPDVNMRFSVNVPSGSNVTIRLAAAHTHRNELLEDFIEKWPDWTFTARVTTFASVWHF